MKDSEFFSCPYCDHVAAGPGNCPDCETSMQKIIGEERFGDDETENDGPSRLEPLSFDDDPDAINWNDGREGLTI